MTPPDAESKTGDDLLTQSAKIIAPGAWQQWMDGTGPDARPVEMARQNYRRAEARWMASQILKLAARTPNLARVLAEIEKDEWVELGIPVRGNPDAERIVEEKYRHMEASSERGAEV